MRVLISHSSILDRISQGLVTCCLESSCAKNHPRRGAKFKRQRRREKIQSGERGSSECDWGERDVIQGGVESDVERGVERGVEGGVKGGIECGVEGGGVESSGMPKGAAGLAGVSRRSGAFLIRDAQQTVQVDPELGDHEKAMALKCREKIEDMLHC